VSIEHTLTHCPHCEHQLGDSIRQHTRQVEDIPPVVPHVTAHTVHGYWCSQCRTIVSAPVDTAMPRSTLGLRFVLYSAWLHYFVGVSVGNCVKIAHASLGFSVSPGGLTLAWKQLATRLEGDYQALRRTILAHGVLHADETGWRINGVTCWLWAFVTAQHCYYLIDPHRGSAVVKSVLGTIFPGILITDFWGAYNAIEALAKQKCYFHLFTELIKIDKLSATRSWRGFRKKLARLLKDAVRLGEVRHTVNAAVYARRKAKLHRRLDQLITSPWHDPHAVRLTKRLRRYRHEMLTFLDHEGVSPYNNHAEQQMRVAVHTRKVSQQNRSAEGAKTHAIFLSLFRTADLQKLNPIDHVMQLAQTSLHGKPTNSNYIPLKIAA
jgi:transposase